MTPRTFWLILIRIIGICLIINSLSILGSFLSSVLYVLKQPDTGSIIVIISGAILTICFYFLVLRYCVFRTEFIIDKLRLDQGFIEETFEIKIHRSTVLKIAVIVLGGVIIIDSLPQLCRVIFSYYQMDAITNGFKSNPNSVWIVFHFVKFSIGFFMMTSSRLIVNFIERKRKGPVAPAEANAE